MVELLGIMDIIGGQNYQQTDKQNLDSFNIFYVTMTMSMAKILNGCSMNVVRT